ncbi:hypothetical protein V8G54_015665, partial [Vigna mungo]
FIFDSLSPKKTQRLEISLPLEGLAPLKPTHTTASVNRNRHRNGPPGPSKESPATFVGHNVSPFLPLAPITLEAPISAAATSHSRLHPTGPATATDPHSVQGVAGEHC